MKTHIHPALRQEIVTTLEYWESRTALSRRPQYYAAALFADGAPQQDLAGETITAMWSYFSGERNSSQAPVLKELFAENSTEYRYTILPDAKHNGIHRALSKDPEV